MQYASMNAHRASCGVDSPSRTSISMSKAMAVTHPLLRLLQLLLWVCSWRWAWGASSPPSTAGMSVCATSAGLPVVLTQPLGFCDNIVGLSCCNSAADAALREEFETMNVPASDAACATIIKAILCQRCIPSTSPHPVNSGSIRPIPPRCTTPLPSSATSSAQPQQQDAGICLERLGGAGADGTNTYLGMAAHPDGSGRAFLYTQDGKVSLASLPARGSGAALQVYGGDGAILDLTGRALRLTGLALHPEFVANERLFVSYTCDSDTSPACSGAGTSSSSPSPRAGNGSRYELVVEEFTTKGVDYGMGTHQARAAPTEGRRIFAVGLRPQLVDAPNQQHGGQIFFRPGDDDGHLYLATGHGVGAGGESSSPFLGKIIRFDVDLMPGNNEPQIFASGLSDPRGCSFDFMRPSDLYCTGVDEQQNEQVYLISNYSASPATAAVSVIISHGRPTAGHILGGILINGGPVDPFLNGRYLYIYNSSVWAAAETPASNASRLHAYPTTRIPNVRCSESSPVPCDGEAIAGSTVFLGQDSSMDVYIITTTGGIYRVIPPNLCASGAPPPALPQQMPPWLAWLISILGLVIFVVIPAISSCLCGAAGAGAGRPTPNWFFNLSCCSWNCCSSGTTN